MKTKAQRLAEERATPEYKRRMALRKVQQEIQRRRTYHYMMVDDARYYMTHPRPETLTALYPDGKVPKELLPKSKALTALRTPIPITDEEIALWKEEQERLGQDTTIPPDETNEPDEYWDARVRDKNCPDSPYYG